MTNLTVATSDVAKAVKGGCFETFVVYAGAKELLNNCSATETAASGTDGMLGCYNMNKHSSAT